MTTREEWLRYHTFKEYDFGVEERVWRTLYEGGDDDTKHKPVDPNKEPERHANRTMHRAATLLSQLVEHLHKQGTISDDDLDEWLFNMTRRA